MENLTQIAVPTIDQVDETSQAVFGQLKSKLGMVPNLYATIGYSSNALTNFLSYSEGTTNGAFNAKEIEAIKLAVSEANNCVYCKSAHTAIAKMNGFSQEETVHLRKGTIEDVRLNVLTNLAKETALKAGNVNEELLEKFYGLGYDEKALIDFVSIVTAITFTNYTHALTKVPVDFPVVD